jgi:hypothetical protein
LAPFPALVHLGDLIWPLPEGDGIPSATPQLRGLRSLDVDLFDPGLQPEQLDGTSPGSGFWDLIEPSNLAALSVWGFDDSFLYQLETRFLDPNVLVHIQDLLYGSASRFGRPMIWTEPSAAWLLV